LGNIIKIGLAFSTFNRASLLEPMIEYLNQNRSYFEEISIVDNGSVDNTFEILSKKIFHEKLKIEKFDINEGPSIGFSKAISNVSKNCTHILLIDDDCIPESDALEIIKSYISSTGAKIVCGGLISRTTNTYDPAHRGMINSNPFSRYLTRPIAKHIDSFIDVSSFNGIIFSYDIYDLVGGINNDFFYNFEDIDLSYRMSRKFPIHYLPSAKFLHLEYRVNYEEKNGDRFLERSARLIFNRRNQMWLAKSIKKYYFLHVFLYFILNIQDVYVELHSNQKLVTRLKHRALAFWHGVFHPTNSTEILKNIYLSYAANISS
jgi:GT2 family glycosyltransferase